MSKRPKVKGLGLGSPDDYRPKVEFEEDVFRAILAHIRAAKENQAALEMLIKTHRLRDPGWRGRRVIPIRRLK